MLAVSLPQLIADALPRPRVRLSRRGGSWSAHARALRAAHRPSARRSLRLRARYPEEREAKLWRPNAPGARLAAAGPGRPPPPSRADLSGLSVLGRFNSLIVDFISLFVRFISLFGRVGNLHLGCLAISMTCRTGSVAGRPGIGFFAVYFRRPGNPIPTDLLRRQALRPD